ncbi:MAG: class I SAM-dependent methyltransferase [Bacteroidota bacterium]|nr:class I SAM-dependent methyltransferase [Bacteroidota bacterium]
MEDKIDIYKNYTTINVLGGIDENALTQWSAKYFTKNFLPYIPENKKSKILEIGCGYGRYIKTLLNLGYTDVLGLDISEEQINYSHKALGLANFTLKQDAFAYFANNNSLKFDVILLIDVAEHLELNYMLELFNLINKHLNSGGRLIVQVPNGMSFLNPIYFSDITHIRAFSYKSIIQSLKLGGFLEIKVKPVPPTRLSILSTIRRIVWDICINPTIKLYMLLANGDTMGGIYTSNLLAIGYK